MESVRFNTIVGPDNVIHPPCGIALPEGEVEVTVKPRGISSKTSDVCVVETRRWLLGLANDAEQTAPDLPNDMAEHHDHYAHGKPLP